MIIGVSGRARAGKDAVAEHLVAVHGFRRRAFADALKAGAKAVFGWDDDHVYGGLKNVVDRYWGFSPRWALQKMGTEAMRDHVADDIWIRALRRHMIDNPWPKWVIPDVRFTNEIKAIRDWGGVLWRLERPGIDDVGAHVSETELDGYRGWDRVIVNEGTLQDLYRRVDDLV